MFLWVGRFHLSLGLNLIIQIYALFMTAQTEEVIICNHTVGEKYFYFQYQPSCPTGEILYHASCYLVKINILIHLIGNVTLFKLYMHLFMLKSWKIVIIWYLTFTRLLWALIYFCSSPYLVDYVKLLPHEVLQSVHYSGWCFGQWPWGWVCSATEGNLWPGQVCDKWINSGSSCQ